MDRRSNSIYYRTFEQKPTEIEMSYETALKISDVEIASHQKMDNSQEFVRLQRLKELFPAIIVQKLSDQFLSVLASGQRKCERLQIYEFLREFTKGQTTQFKADVSGRKLR